jgi:hypothetical protein
MPIFSLENKKRDAEQRLKENRVKRYAERRIKYKRQNEQNQHKPVTPKDLRKFFY